MRITEVADDVFFVEGHAVNWTILRDGTDLTLIDGGYPRDADQVLESLDTVGGSLRAALVTHAHVDHIGGLRAVIAQRPAPVLTGPREAAHARREFLEQATPLDVMAIAWRPSTWPWIRHVVASGGTSRAGITAEAIGTEELPGRPVPVATPGHTSGHTAYLARRVLITGDALVTGHPLSRHEGPQRLLPFFEHDPDEADRSLDVLAGQPATVIAPGHGPAWHGSPAEAVRIARAR